MRGASSFVVFSGLFACALVVSPVQAGDTDAARALAREKAAAVSILKTNGAKQIATMAQDRVFIAYLNASTQGQGARLRGRMAAMFTTLWNRFGLRDVALVDRAGELVVRVGHAQNAPTSFNVKRDPILLAGLAQKQMQVATVVGADALTFAAPVVWREQAEFVLSARQSFSTYRKVLARGTAKGTFVMLIDAKGQILADTRTGPAAGTRGKLVAGLSLEGVRKAVKGSRDEGTGEVVRGNDRFSVSYQSVGDWTVVAGGIVIGAATLSGCGDAVMWLRIKLTAVFAACIALPLGLVLCAVWVGGNESLRVFAERDLKAATQTVAATIEARLALDLTHLKTFGGLPVMQDTLIADGGGEIARVLSELKTQYPEFVELTVTDARGTVIAATSKGDIGRPAAAEEGFRSAASGTVYQGPLVVRDAPAKTTISFTVPLTAAYDRQTVIGTLFGVVDFAVLVKAAKAQSILASDQNVILVARRLDGRTGFATRSDGALLDAVQRVASRGDGAGEISWRESSYFVSSAPSKGKGLVRDPGFTVRTVAPAETALGAVDQMLTIAATVAVMGGILALAFAWRWATPLVQLGTAMGRVAHGEAARAPQVAPTNTFAPLARSFESLRQTKAMHMWLVGRERELLREKEAAERALHEKSEHLASLSRALKGQLATIVELSEAINSQALTSATGLSRANQAKDISRSGMQLLAVINDLIELSEAEAGRSPLRDGDIDLAALVRESVDVMRDAAHKARIFLACDGADEELLVRADAQKMKQVMFNLLSNAVKFTPEHGRVHVTLKTDVNGRPAIVIADTGIGMPATLTPLASPFSAVDDANTHGRHGAGLGLPLARQLVEMHDGTLEIESEAGEGTTVTVALPVERLIAKTEDAALLIA